jgi:dipeptidase D
LKKDKVTGTEWTARLYGLQGGHSGAEIHKERGNSNKLAGRLLYDLRNATCGVSLVDVNGGLAYNAIPRETTLRFVAPADEAETIQTVLDTFRADVKAELATKDPGFEMEVSSKAVKDAEAFDAFAPAAALVSFPNGVQAMSADVKGLVETSLNLGILKIVGGDSLHAEFSVRSSVESSRVELTNRLIALTKLAGGINVITGEYPGWKFRVDSPLREKMIRVYERQYGRKPGIEAIHAGLECGLLASKISDLDAVSIGPDMMDIHTTEERLSISSTERVFNFVCSLLAEKD